jgi:hypothetical protein
MACRSVAALSSTLMNQPRDCVSDETGLKPTRASRNASAASLASLAAQQLKSPGVLSIQ